ncbi:MAG TPA: ATP-binding protein [Acidobacteriota bacterium]
MRQNLVRISVSLGAVGLVTLACRSIIDANPATVGFLYLITVLLIAAKWGLQESILASIAGSICFNFFFLPPVGTLTIAHPQNWAALIAFLVTALVASHLSESAKRRAAEAVNRHVELERLYALCRAILLTDQTQPIPKQIAQGILAIYGLEGVAIFDRATGELEIQVKGDSSETRQLLQEAVTHRASVLPVAVQPTVSHISLGGNLIGILALKGSAVSETALQALTNLVAIGLEKARGEEVARRAESARETQEFKSTLLDALAHEFKTPLTSIKASTSAILSSGVTKSEQKQELLTIIDQEADRLSGLVTETIQLARLEAGNVQLSRRSCSVSSLIEPALQRMGSVLEGREVSVQIDGNLPAVYVDVELLRMLVRELLDNAVKYSPHGSPIRIEAKSVDNTVVIKIRNSGDGLSEAERSKIFERFYRGAKTSQYVSGSGMGLAVAREILLAHGGDLWVKSSPGEGAEFFASVPLSNGERST